MPTYRIDGQALFFHRNKEVNLMQSSSTDTDGRPLVGISLVVLATLAFALSDTVTKHLAMLYPVPVVIAVRYLVNLVLMVVFFLPGMRSHLWQAQKLPLLLLRGLCLAAASLTMALALRVMPVGETVAIIYLAPFAVMLLAVPLLGEKVGVAGWLGASFGFLGVLLIARPGGGLDPLGVVFALINACLATTYHLLTRYLSRTETTISMLFHTAWVGALIFLVMAVPNLPQVLPPAVDIGLMVLLGALMSLGHFLFTAAYREAPASLLAPVNYLHLVWAGGLGFLVFGHVPDQWGLAGMALVAGAGVVVALGSHAAKRRAKAAKPAAVDPLIPIIE
jgi:drug/metabolite transporter (DMT)-like permease